MGIGVSNQAPANQQTPALLHRFLGIGLILAGGALIAARHFAFGSGPPETPTVALVLTALAATQAAAALMLLKRLVPPRKPGQLPTEYWTDSAVTGPALRFWFILEGAGVIAAVAYFLGGGPAAAAVLTIALVTFWLNGPRALTD